MSPRRRMAVGAAAALALLLAWRTLEDPVARRVRSVTAFATRELAVRRLGGSSAAFDRRYFIFLESVRRKLPPRTAGVVIATPAPGDPALYLAAYTLAPVPVALSPARAPREWLLAVYGPGRPPGWNVISEFPGGALLAPAPS
ncbi:MAG TPA: hypothetical protein VKJ00_07445 [Thermoanaerobaculia bacterium]|nr:hypothetical protein [Thermoanaerobaculia bacterium]